MIIRAWQGVVLALAGAFAAACPSVPEDPWSPQTMPIFDPTDPANPIVPQPNDLIMNPLTGLVAIPDAARTDTELEYLASFMNTLDGFPVNSTLSCLFTAADVDAATVGDETVRVYDVTDAVAAALGGAELAGPGVERLAAGSFTFVVAETGHPATGLPVTGLTLIPKRPLDPGRRFAVLVTTGVKTTGGQAIGASFLANLVKSRSPLVDANGLRTVLQSSLTDADAAQLEPVRALNDAALSAIEGQDAALTRDQVALAWTFPTHSGSVAEFDPLNNAVPQPNDMVRGADGTLDIPTAGLPAALTELYGWMNEQDGFSVSSTPEVRLTRKARAETVVLPSDDGPEATLAFLDVSALPPENVEATVEVGTTGLLRLHPKARLTQGHTYLVALSRRIVTEEGGRDYPLLPSPVQAFLLLENPLMEEGENQLPLFLGDADATRLEGFRQATAQALPLLASMGMPRGDLASVFAFTTMTTAENVYDPNANAIPFPNDLVKMGDQLLLPVAEDASPAEKELIGWMKTLDGFSHVQHGYVDFTAPIDAATAPKAFVFVKISGETGLPTNTLAASAVAGASRVDIVPTEALAPGTAYAVVVTHDLKAADGSDLVEANVIRLLKSEVPLVSEDGKNQLPGVLDDFSANLLEGNRQKLAPLLDGLAAFGTPRDEVLSFWVFSTHTRGEALFDPTLSLVPFPNDLLLARDAQSQVVGVNLPIPADASELEKQFLSGLRKLDGFSALGASTAAFSKELDGATIATFAASGSIVQHLAEFADVSVAVADITPVVKNPQSTAALGQVKVLGPDQALLAAAGKQLVVAPQPGFPFEGGHTYMAVVLDGLDTTDATGIEPSPIFVMARSANRLVNDLGQSYVSALDDATAAMLEMLRQNYQPMFDALAGDFLKVPRERVRLFWTFTVQGITEPLVALRSAAKDAPYADGTASITGNVLKPAAAFGQIPAGTDTTHLRALIPDGSFEGHLLLGSADFTNPAKPALQPFQATAEGAPAWSTDKTHPQLRVPFVLAVPSGEPPAAGWPVVLFQHGMTRDKSDVWLLADRLAQAGFASLAIDAVWHGGRALPGVSPDQLYMFPDPFVARDHYRQTVLDLFEAVRLLRSGTLEGWLQTHDPANALPLDNPNLLSGDVYYVGMSLGAQLGAAFAAVEQDVKAVVLNVPGAHLTKMLAESPDPGFKGVIGTLLQQAGVAAGSAAAAQLIATLQWALDPSDPVNYLAHLCSKPLDGHARLPVFVQRASDDEFIVPAITDEIVATLENDGCVGQIQTDTYLAACHAFLIGCVGEGAQTKTERERAVQGILDFLVAARAQ